MPETTFLRRLLASLALICAGLSAQAAPGPAALRVVLDDNYPPYSFRNAGGETQGILKELWALWAQRTGIAVDFQPMDWAKARATMESGKADVIDTIFETEERRALYEFSAPYATIAVSLFFDERISGIADAQSAKGFTIGVKDGDACIDYLAKQGIGDLKRFASYEAQVRAAVRQEIRVLCIDNPPAYYFFNREGRIAEFRHSPPLYEGQFHWAVAKGRKELQKLVADGFARISVEERQAIEQRWLGEKLDAGPWVRYARPLAYGLVALSLLIAALFVWSWMLRRQVAGRMSELSTTLGSLKKSEARIRELLDEQHLIFDNAHVGILLLRNRQILKCNQRIAEMFGFATPDELKGLTTEIFYCTHEQFAYAGRKGYADLAKTGSSNLEFEMCRQDGKTIWVIQTGRPLDPDNVLEAPSIWVYTDITERKQAEIALRQSRQVFSSAFESCPIAASIASAEEGRFIQVNTNYERDFGWRKQELIGRSSLEIGLWPDQETRQAWVAAMHREGRLLDYETVWLNSRGERRCVSLSSEIIELDNQPCILAYVSDITARKRAEADLRIAAAAFESREAMMVTDADGVILQVNHAFTESTGYSAAELIGQTPRLFKSGRHDDEFYRGLWQAIIDTGGWQGEIWDRRKNGEIYPKWLTISAVKDQAGKVTHYVGTHFDITERKKSEERIQALAFNDQLTGLANRFSLSEWLDRALAVAGGSGRQLALMMIDLDNFKIINDTLGHQIGDQLLMEIANRLKNSVRHTDLVARLGGDEFVVVLAEIDTPEIAAHVADKILSLAALPCVVDGNELRTSTSIGICLFPDDATGSQDLIKKADAAMYHAKASGRGNYQFFKEEIQLAAVKRRTIENDLRKAIERREFLLHYQPQLDLRSGRLVGVEALIRWQHPEKGMISPLDFIPIAEETGLILPIGDWVLEEACRQLAHWRSRGIDGIRMSVNLTASQFLNRSLPDRIQVLLRQYDLGTELINLEVTESMSMASPEQTIASMKELTDCGLSLAIDDFGTGYSSLSYLKLFPLSTLKIDRSFVKDIETDQNDACICDVTVLLAHKLGLDVVAEGVETEAQLKYLLSIGCEKIQGYLISKPLPADEAERFILSNPMISGLGTADLWLPQEA